MTAENNVEIIMLGDYDPERRRRDFDAVSYGKYYWRGRLDFVLWKDPEEGVFMCTLIGAMY